MSHTTREKTKLLNRVRRIRGQMEAVERSLEDEKGCAEVLQLIAGVRGAINGLMAANAMVMPLVPESLDFISSTQFWGLFADLCRTFADLEPNKAFDFVSVLLSKVDNGPSSAAPIVRSWSQRAYGDWLLPVEIPMSSVVGSEALEFATIYDIEAWSGSKRTLDRIRDPFDQFCKLVDEEFYAKWTGAAK